MTGRLHFDCRHRYAAGFQLEAAFEASDGVTALFGPSGAGKSTILALIAGTLRPQTGLIRLGERILVDTPARVWLPSERRRVGVVFQDQRLFPHLTVRQNLIFGRRRAVRPLDLGRVAEVLEVAALLDRRPDSLSGGQRQRVALGRALLSGPEFLLLDEALAALDASLKDRVLTYLERVLAEWRVPTLFVSHDQADVRRLADRVVVVEAGRVVASGPVGETLDNALLKRMKHAPSPVNLLRLTDVGRVDGHWEGRLGEQRLHLPGEAASYLGRAVCVQFLPRDVTLAAAGLGEVSARNRLRGVVRELAPLPDRTFVAIDVGQFLWAEVTPEAVRELGLEPGRPVTCLIKATAMELAG